VKTVLRVDRAENEHPLAAIFAPQIVALAPTTPMCSGLDQLRQGSDAARRGCSASAGQRLMAVESAYRFRRPIYAGNAIVTVEADAARNSWHRARGLVRGGCRRRQRAVESKSFA
jgi:electron transfer flavoprotein alpha subunit